MVGFSDIFSLEYYSTLMQAAWLVYPDEKIEFLR
jgi:hypothetical protein